MKKQMIVVLSSILILFGCASNKDVETVNIAVAAKRTSYTDSVSRIQAKESQRKLSRRRENYLIGPDDVLEVRIFELEAAGQATTLDTRVSKNGYILLPVIGSIKVVDKNVSQIQKEIIAVLKQRQILSVPLVNIQITEFNSKKINVIGAIREPGIYTLKENVSTLLDILGEAKGLSDNAGYQAYVIKKENRLDLDAEEKITSEIKARQDDKEKNTNVKENSLKEKSDKIHIDLFELIGQGNLELNMVLEDGDAVFVPNAEEFTVDGHVNEAGTFPLKKPTTVLEAVALAGGLTEEASPTYCLLKRQKNDEEEAIDIDLSAILERRQPNIYLQSNDILFVRQTTAKYVYQQVTSFLNLTLAYNLADIITP
ncbi:polysaccharide biosynthesis protein [Candidatus Uabimicrobium amorphum]|uniref:Polysaccharide biosynthesis protein n=2 Tax=Uabimicrobium amorphum TaxID=2596890 RepID=A0A5S9IHC3_UABAM|nr:polysaccharide biosynthesis protein [Candidatus Uabimicrobium amorphum]